VTPDEIRDEADQAARDFAAQLAKSASTSTGIPKPPEITVTLTETEVEKFGLRMKPQSATSVEPASGQGGASVGPILTGACCKPDGTCTIVTSGDCAALGGVYQGDGSPCEPNPCGGCINIPVSLGPGPFTGCAATVDSASYGPWVTDMNVSISGEVDDDLMVNGVITQAGEFAFDDCSGCLCESSNGNNGAHTVSYSLFLPAGATLDLQLLNWFSGTCSFNGNINLCPATGGMSVQRAVDWWLKKK
jgi:hypothetical protein